MQCVLKRFQGFLHYFRIDGSTHSEALVSHIWKNHDSELLVFVSSRITYAKHGRASLMIMHSREPFRNISFITPSKILSRCRAAGNRTNRSPVIYMNYPLLEIETVMIDYSFLVTYNVTRKKSTLKLYFEGTPKQQAHYRQFIGHVRQAVGLESKRRGPCP